MAVFKCKMCGASLDIVEGSTVCECEYCGTKQTVPKAMDENMQNLCNRANTLRMKGEFDKAAQIYEKIVQLDSTQSEAYWGLILCKYGIEYVDDPATLKKIPTCHRASYDSIIADEDYKSALANADIMQRSVYEEQAKEIDRIQKEILALAQKEETYDVFICYKETDANGQRTQDSVIANDIYYQLTNEGYKVFYAAITLEGKLGSAYEPIIFAALNSAKVMLVIGTNPDYFNAVWVKNEWSRFLKIIQKDRSKLLIPCYRDMDAYELPEEFAHLQAQDMSKIGFINDIVRGIKKVIVKNDPKTTVAKETTVVNANVAPLLERVFMFLEDGEWESADEYCEKVLDIEPKNAQAYLGKLMAELKVKTKDKLKDCATPFDNKGCYQKTMRFGDDELKKILNDAIEYINIRNENARIEKMTRNEKAQRLVNALKYVLEVLKQQKIEEGRKRKAEEERKRKEKEEIKRKAEEERKCKVIEEKKKCEALWTEYISALEYEKERENKRRTINADIEILTKQVENLIIIKNNWDSIEAKISQLTEKEKNLSDKISQLNIELNSLGFFAIKRKKEIPVIIQDYERQRNSTRREIENVSKEKQGYKSFGDLCNAIDKVEEKIVNEKDNLNNLNNSSNHRGIKTISSELLKYEYGKFLVEGYQLESNGHIKFGFYPQTKVIDSSLINILNNKAGALPTSANSQAWASYKYYIEGKVSDFMWYVDVTNGNDKYRGVYFTSYRLGDAVDNSFNDKIYQSIYGYSTNTVYWFKYEPVSWTVLSRDDQTVFMCCDMVIDSQQFDYDGQHRNNNYAKSTMRKWLNETFYNIAFSEIQRQKILTTMVDNSAATTDRIDNIHVCENTQDKIFLLSVQDVINIAYGFASDKGQDISRVKSITDYAKVQGGNGNWWLRSPFCSSYSVTRRVSFRGNLGSSGVTDTVVGVVPALRIRL